MSSWQLNTVTVSLTHTTCTWDQGSSNALQKNGHRAHVNYRLHLSSLSFQIQKVGGASTSRFNSATLSSRIRSQPRGKSVLEKEHDRQIGWVEYGGMGEKTAVKHFLVVLTKPGRSGYQWTADFWATDRPEWPCTSALLSWGRCISVARANYWDATSCSMRMLCWGKDPRLSTSCIGDDLGDTHIHFT